MRKRGAFIFGVGAAIAVLWFGFCREPEAESEVRPSPAIAAQSPPADAGPALGQSEPPPVEAPAPAAPTTTAPAIPAPQLSESCRRSQSAASARLGQWRKFERAGVTLRWYGSTPTHETAYALIDEAVATAYEAASVTGGPVNTSLELVVYPDKASMRDWLCVPSWSGAVFEGHTLHLAQSPEPPGVSRTSLRHETMHAAISQLTNRVPTWLNEGLAQRFEVQSRGRRQRQRALREQLVRNQTWIPFSSLGGSLSQLANTDDALLAYTQSLAMVEFLIDRGGAGAPERALRYLVNGGDPARLLEYAIGSSAVTERDFLDWLTFHVDPDPG